MQNYAPRFYMPQHSCWGRPDMANVKVWGAPFFNKCKLLQKLRK